MNISANTLDLAWGLLGQQRFAEAAQQAAAFLDSFPDNVSGLACHAMALWKSDGDIAVSLHQIRRAVELAPNVASIRHNYATLLASNGDIEEAAGQFREALRIKPDDTLAFYGLTQNHKFREETDLVRAMVALHGDSGLDANRREFLAYGLAKVYDDLGVADRAFPYAIEANRLGARPFDLPGEARALDELKELARLDAFRRARNSGHPTQAPLFIVGMNRSGTTLVESILSRHPDVLARGERNDLFQIELAALQAGGQGGRRLDRHELTLAMTRDWMAAQAERLVRSWNAGTARIVTDKQPENAVRLGLVARLLPHARIIHVRRHPLDTGISNFFQRFSAGQGYSTRLDWIGLRTRQIADAMAAWKTALDLAILDVSYEKLVADPETQSRRIVDFAGLEWTDSCLEPQRTARGVLTASQWQVRQPINTASVARWKRYEPWLAPMIEAMGGMGWIEREVADAGGR